MTEQVQNFIEFIGTVIEVYGVAVIGIGVAYATFLFVSNAIRPDQRSTLYKSDRGRLGRVLLLGLEILVAADIVRTVALEPSFENVAVLGLLVLVRTFLSWSIVVEIEGRWPWQPKRAEEESQSV
jgi:uncharacterized membrane protein